MSAEEQTAVILFSFYGAFLIDLLIVAYAYKLIKRMGGRGDLYRTTVFAGLSAFVFGVHHIGELFLENIPHGAEIAESVEGIAAVLLIIAALNLYKISKGME